MTVNRQILLKQRPNGVPTPEDFALAEAPMPVLADGELLIQPAPPDVVGDDPDVGDGFLPDRPVERDLDVGLNVVGVQLTESGDGVVVAAADVDHQLLAVVPVNIHQQVGAQQVPLHE